MLPHVPHDVPVHALPGNARDAFECHIQNLCY